VGYHEAFALAALLNRSIRSIESRGWLTFTRIRGSVRVSGNRKDNYEGQTDDGSLRLVVLKTARANGFEIHTRKETSGR